MKIRIVNRSSNPLPGYQSSQAAGMDIHAALESGIELLPLQRMLIPTGLFIELPAGFEAQIRPRSGLAINHGITVVNAPGTIDADYRGEIKIALINLSETGFVINNGDRIAQMVISRHESVTWERVEKINLTRRKDGGFGSTGKQ